MAQVVHVMAGKPYPIDGELVHHASFDGKSILERTVDAATIAQLPVIGTVHQSERVSRSVSSIAGVQILEAPEAPVDSFLVGLGQYLASSTLAITHDVADPLQVKILLDEFPQLRDLAILYVGSDSPFIRPQDFDAARQAYREAEQPDVLVMATPIVRVRALDEALSLGLDEVDSTIMNATVTDRGELRISNMYVVKPFALLEKGYIKAIQGIYDHRRLSDDYRNVLGIAKAVVPTLGGMFLRSPFRSPLAIVQALWHSYSMAQHIRGKNKGKPVQLSKWERAVSCATGLDVQVSTHGGLGSFLDVDDAASLALYRGNFKSVQGYLRTRH